MSDNRPQMCPAMGTLTGCSALGTSTVTGYVLYCTLGAGHHGQHEAHGVSGAVIQAWA